MFVKSEWYVNVLSSDNRKGVGSLFGYERYLGEGGAQLHMGSLHTTPTIMKRNYSCQELCLKN